MIELLNKISKEEILLEVVDGKLKLFANDKEIDSELLNEIRTRKDEIIQYLLNNGSLSSSNELIEKVNPQLSYPISNAQRRLWVLSQFEEGLIAYNLPGNAQLNQNIDVDCFKKAIDATLERHEILRTVFKEDETGEIRQWILDKQELGFKIDYKDFRKEKNKEEKVKHYILEDSYKPFDLEKGPLLRAALLQVEDEHYTFYFNMHHIISDGWSMEVLKKDVLAFYQAFKNKEQPALKELRIHYKDYSAWSLLQSDKAVFQSHKEYWLKSLEGYLPLLNLPTTKQRPRIKTYNGHTLSTYFTKDISQKLAGYSRDNNGSLYMTLLASWNVLMYYYTSQTDIIIGTPVAGREHANLEDQIGFYLNLLALRNEVNPEESFTTFYKRVKENTLKSFSHQLYPFDKLPEDLNLKRDASRSAVFDVLIDFHNTGEKLESVELSEKEIDAITDLGTFPVKYDLELHFTEAGDHLSLLVNFNEDVYEKKVIEKIVDTYKRLVAALLLHPAALIKEIDFLSEAEKNQLLKGFNDTKTDYPQNATLVDLFEEQVKNAPDNLAIRSGEKTFTYKELDEVSNQLAHCLVETHALKAGSLVGIKLDKSEWAVISMLAVLKAGAAYIPIDPEYPVSRKQHILSEADIKLLITNTSYVFDEEVFEGSVFAVDIEFESEKYSTARVNEIKNPASLAYVIYTSGSTGNPKGVMIEHSSLANYLYWARSSYSAGISNRFDFGLFTSLSFDLTVTSIFLPLISGGKLTLFPSSSDISSLLKAYVESNIACIKITPAHINLLAALELKNTNIRLAIVGGDKLENTHVEILKKLNREIRIYNEYGPTESTVGCIVKEITSGKEEILIGKPIANTQIYILNTEAQMVPHGAIGEICIGGAGLARGYMHQQELTKEKFIKNPFQADECLYKTGDLGRWLADGNIKFLGRKDEQVKIHGYRIELGEIERVLLKHEAIKEAVVVARENEKGEKELVAYITSGTEQDTAGLRAHLKEFLPEYMLPAYYIQMEVLPVNANGKIDKKALPDPQGLTLGNGVAYMAPGNEMEKKLAEIWEEVLYKQNIGIKDEFFTIGGDSIRAIQIVVQIKKNIKKEISVAELYKHSTIETLAVFLASQKVYKQDTDWSLGMEMIEAFKQRIVKGDGKNKLPEVYKDLYPMTPIELGMIYSSLLKPEEPIYADQFIESLYLEDVEEYRSAISILVNRHPIFRTKYFITSFEEPVKIVYDEIDIPLFVHDLSHLSKEEMDNEVQARTQNFLDMRLSFNDELLWSMHLYKIRSAQYLVVFCCHHAMLDGWSLSVFTTELSELLATKNQAKLPEMKCDYKDYVASVLGRQNSEVTTSFWQNLLGDHNRNKLPFNYKRTKISPHKGMLTVSVNLKNQLLERLEQVAQNQQTSVKSIFLAAHIYLLRILSGENEVITGVVTHDRPELQRSDRIMGCFLNTVPIKVDFKKIKNFKNLLQFVQAYLIEVKPHEVHLTDIVRMIGEKASNENPIFDTLLNFTDFHELDNWKASTTDSYIDKLFSDEISIPNEMTNTYFDMEVDKTLERLKIKLKYVPAYFNEQEIRYALDMYVRILENYSSDMDSPLQPSLLLLPKDKHFLLEEFNNTVEPYSKEKLVFELFEDQVKQTPKAIALRQDGLTLTYKELNEKANQLARFLVDQKVKPGDNIGLLVDRSFDMIIGMYGILKAGAAYVPIDPEYPADRQKYIIENSAVSKVVCDASYPVTEDLEQIRFIKPDSLNCQRYPVSDLGIKVDPEQLAYTIYTSGSTGRPKGVMIEHHSAVNLVEWVNKTFSINESDRLLFITSMCFDLSVYDIFGILSSGGSIVITKKEQIQNVEKLLSIIQQEQITFWDSVPTTMNYLVSELEGMNEVFTQESLRVVFLSGDWIPVQLPNRIKNYFPAAQVISLGGATEGTVWSNYYPIEKVDEMWNSIPYGKPISNNFFYILDENREPVPPGVAGELYIGGVGVARGYANDAEKTNAAFYKDPFHKNSGGRMYRTGDLGRMLPGGNMEFLGRVDHQVKIRGFRVELGEIESILCKNDQIKEAVVDVVLDQSKNNQLVAYYVSHNEIDLQKLRSYLQEYLPGYMIPSAFIKLPELPLTSNGKINRKALPKPLELESTVAYVAPRNETEELIAQTFREILGVERIGINDNFFELGGHSLTATRLLSRIEKNLSVKIDLTNLFNKPTVSGLSEYIDTVQWMKQKSNEVDSKQNELII